VSALESGRVRVVPYDPAWPEKYADEARRIRRAAGGLIVDIQHIGSTAIPGMSAKPIIDIAVAVADLDAAHLGRLVSVLTGLGYEYRGLLFGREGHHLFRKGDPREFFLHVFDQRSRLWTERVAFRDYLVGHPAVATEYRKLKQELAARYPDDRASYTAAKTAFVG
jgi:GrpB-like predicted nucleotidyltransferase (UPF0157 family)